MRRFRAVLSLLALSGAAALAFLAAPAARAEHATIYAGTWGPAGARMGHVHRYESGTTWTDLTPGGLADCVWDLEWIGGELWAATHDGPPSTEDPDTPHGSSGRIFKWDGATWHDMSPPGGFSSAVTTVSNLNETAYITVDHLGLLRHAGGNSWVEIARFRLAAQAIVSSVHDGRPLLYLGQDNTDEFWVHDPEGLLPCGDPAPDPRTGAPRCQIPTGDVCSADCFPGSCIHAFEEFDNGIDGTRIYAGTWHGLMYRWEPTTRLFERIDSIPLPGPPSDHVDGLAWYHGRLMAGLSNGQMWSSVDATAATWIMETSFGNGQPISEMVRVPEDDLVWIGFGGVPWRWARRDGEALVRTYDGTSYTARSGFGQFGQGVLVILPVVPFVNCDAGADQVVPCGDGPVSVTLDGSGTTWSQGFDLTATWSGPFLEGTADGLVATVTFPGPGEYTVTLTASVRGVTETCTTLVSVRDDEPPVVSLRDACLWPPNHRYRCFSLEDLAASGVPLASDECSGIASVSIVDVRSSQPEDVGGGGDGHTEDDAMFDDGMACLRSERQGGDPAGRTYEIVVEVVDGAGNATQGIAVVRVPHDERVPTRCRPEPRDVGLLPNAALPLGPGAREGSYP